jgi:hypothetical protein
VTHADLFGPPSFIKNQEISKVSSVSFVKLEFEVAPIRYEVRTWTSDYNFAGIFKEVNLSNNIGTTVFEVLATWEQGNASFAFVLDIEAK